MTGVALYINRFFFYIKKIFRYRAYIYIYICITRTYLNEHGRLAIYRIKALIFVMYLICIRNFQQNFECHDNFMLYPEKDCDLRVITVFVQS